MPSPLDGQAAKALAGCDNQFSRIECELVRIRSEVNWVKGMVGVAIALNVTILARLLLQ